MLDITKTTSVHIQRSSILPYKMKIDSQICFSDSSSFTGPGYHISFKRLKGGVVDLSYPSPIKRNGAIKWPETSSVNHQYD